MPFIKDGEETRWVAPTNEDIRAVRDDIVSARPVTAVSVPDELREKLMRTASAGSSMQQGWNIVAASNRHLYNTIQSMTTRTPGAVDIILPVHNALHIVKPCIEAVLARTHWPYNLIVVDDASDKVVSNELKCWLSGKENVKFIVNKKNKGFAATVNIGIKQSKGEYVCLLNSDVLVTERWLTKMMMSLKADPRNQIVCPATNNTAVVEIPMAQGASYLGMNRVLEQFAVRAYPEIMPTGFCFLFPRSLTEKIGLFDEAYKNFGEESDFWMKTISYLDGADYPRYRAVMADDTYVFHERGSSYSALGRDEHMVLRKNASSRFHKVWPQFYTWKKSYNPNKVLGHLRQDIPAEFFNLFQPSYRICWVVHSTSMCGGMKYIADIVNRINEKGGDARVALIKRNPEAPVEVLSELRSAPIVFNSPEQFLETFPQRGFSKGVVVAATSELVPVVSTLTKLHDNLRPVLHVQSYEPDMVDNEAHKRQLREMYKKFSPVISNSSWITKKLKEDGVNPFATIPPGVDLNLFYSRNREEGDERLTVMIPLSKAYMYRGYNRGLFLIQELESLAKTLKVDLRILVYGVDTIPLNSQAICLGVVPQTHLAKILGTEVDIFIDPSHEHSYGMPALEALASGATVVSWNNKGIWEYIESGKTGEIFDEKVQPSTVAAKILDLLASPKERAYYAQNVIELGTLNKHRRDVNVDRFIDALEHELHLSTTFKRIVFVTPHMRKHGGPTTIIKYANALAKRGHNVSITTVYSDINAEVVAMTDLPISTDAQAIPTCDILITNSDNPMNTVFVGLKQAKKKIMLKLSHNERFKQLEEDGLKLPWDAVVTTTKWLKEQCENVTEGWDYKPVKATRIGWWHYGHKVMDKHPDSRSYNEGTVESPITIGFLVHRHPLKGTKETVKALSGLYKKYGSRVRFFGIGEVDPKQLKLDLPNFRYFYTLNRGEMAELFARLDIWVGASHTEGLGRIALETMSAGAACVLSDTAAEFTKNNHNCLLYPVGDAQMLAEKVNFLIQNPEIMKKIRESGYTTAMLAADSTPAVEAFCDVIEEIFNAS
jgi:glycosyltransferase involved in cell wall biosynthesis/GT2 family glycosyltransferase